MFKELKELIRNRPLTITVVSLNDDRIRVNVIPHVVPKDTDVNGKIKHSHKNEVAEVPDSALKALSTPLSLTGTPDEIDAALPKALSDFAEVHGQLQQTLDKARNEISEAVKAIDEREKNKAKSKSSAGGKNPDKDANSKSDKKPDDAGLLPLWCKPPASNGNDQGGQASSATDTAQPGIHPQATQEVSSSCQ
jgi:PRTRC genetic system protein E